MYKIRIEIFKAKNEIFVKFFPQKSRNLGRFINLKIHAKFKKFENLELQKEAEGKVLRRI